ncbi:MAG: hypothetical protein K0Q89_2985 [Thermomicrobiales bacterium]|nr:hypothetical protein [Thermomicrobiales bacterium]
MGTVRIRRTPAAVVPPASPAPAASPPPRMTAEAARRVLESVIIAIITSTGLYLVGSVYSEAYYGRMSIEVSALDLTPPYVALQAVHVVRSLLEYPVTLLGLYFLSRFVITRLPRVRTWAVSLLGRFGRLALLIANGLIVLPLVLAAVNATLDPALVQTNSPLSEVASLMALGGTVLVLYVLWLSVGPRQLLLSELQHRKLVPIVLLFTLYLLDALVATAHNATVDADLFMTGASDSSMAAVFTMASGVQPLPSTDVLCRRCGADGAGQSRGSRPRRHPHRVLPHAHGVAGSVSRMHTPPNTGHPHRSSAPILSHWSDGLSGA